MLQQERQRTVTTVSVRPASRPMSSCSCTAAGAIWLSCGSNDRASALASAQQADDEHPGAYWRPRGLSSARTGAAVLSASTERNAQRRSRRSRGVTRGPGFGGCCGTTRRNCVSNQRYLRTPFLRVLPPGPPPPDASGRRRPPASSRRGLPDRVGRAPPDRRESRARSRSPEICGRCQVRSTT